MPEIDLATPEAVVAYLAGSPFAVNKATEVSVRLANSIWRLHLLAPYDGQWTLILKYSRGYFMEMGARKPFPTERQIFEARAMRFVRSFLPADALATVPAVHRLDEEVHVIIMDDCGEESVTVKEFLKSHNPTPEIARQIGTALGDFLAALHQQRDPATWKVMDKHEQAKTLSAWCTYERLVSTITNKNDLPALADPATFSVSPEIVEVIERIGNSTAADIKTGHHDTIVMGDFWTGNVVVKMRPDGQLERLWVVDWELVKTGLAALDVGQFIAELHTLRQFHPDSGAAAEAAVHGFWAAYRGHIAVDAKTKQTAIVHVGTHLVIWTPRVAWGTEEKTREVVEEGIGLITGGAEDHWLRGVFDGNA